MNIQFFGGAQTVTGSQHLLTVNGSRILLECGLYQGRRKEMYERNKTFPFDPSEIDVLLLSHAHIDHSGNIPNLVKNGFRGKIFATGATVDLCQVMLRDSAFLHEKDADFVNKIRRKKREEPVEPLYTIEDAEASLDHFFGIEYRQAYEVAPGVVATYRDAGHILGSASILLEINEEGRLFRFGFTGDLGRRDIPLLRDPDYLRDLDCLVMESTYGNREHRVSEDIEEELAKTVRDVAAAGGKIIIPAFAVGRTQLLVYMLHKLFDQNRIPDMPIFVDSPMAVNATEVFRRNPEALDRETHRIFLTQDLDPFGFGRLRYIREASESKKLNHLNYPHIIISASGMAEGGRILHHLKNNIEEPRNMVLFVGFAAEETLARRLMDGEEKVKIFGETYRVRCKIKRFHDFSAHADRKGLLDYVRSQPREKLKKIFLVHGEAEQAEPLIDAIRSQGYFNVQFPSLGSKWTL